MHIDTDGLHSGANTSYRAADHAHEGASGLARAGIAASIFGDFEAAAAFHEAVTTAHGKHSALLTHHGDQLGTLGDKAHSAAARFRDMEHENADRLTL